MGDNSYNVTVTLGDKEVQFENLSLEQKQVFDEYFALRDAYNNKTQVVTERLSNREDDTPVTSRRLNLLDDETKVTKDQVLQGRRVSAIKAKFARRR